MLPFRSMKRVEDAGATPAGLSHPTPPAGDAGGSASLNARERAARAYGEYGPAVYRRCLRLLKDKEAAKDATQEVFIKLLRDIGKLEDPRTALPWAYRVATNHCLNVLRNARRHGEEALEPDLEIAERDDGPQYPERQLARKVLAQFDLQTQSVAIGVFVDGMEHEEVAEALGISRRTVSRKLDRFVKRAKELFGRGEP